VGAGAIGMALAASIRIWDTSFWALFAGQLGIAAAQPYVVNGISKLVADWFSEEHGALATGLVTMGMFLGMAAGMATTPPLVTAFGLRTTMIVFAGVAWAAALAFGLFVHSNDRLPSFPSKAGAEPAEPLLALFSNAGLRSLFGLSLLGIGVFNGLTTWLEPILLPQGIDSEGAGAIGGLLIVGGIVGAVAIPALSDASKRRKPFLVLSAAGALATIYPLCSARSYGLLLALAAAHGFFIMPALALLLEMCSQLAGARRAGSATSLLMMAGNLGGVVVIVAVPLIKGDDPNLHRGVLLMTALLVLTLLLTFRAPETFVRRSTEG
jgi:predicted MFS family arabinose efflux permease